jgi:sugar-specific transcriptional regulator TrmB
MTYSPNRDKLIQILEKIGLSDNESAVYLASLSLGPTKILNLAKSSGVKRTTVYAVIQALQQKGLMRRDVRGLKNVFVPEDPSRLEAILEDRNREFRDFFPQFKSLYNLEGSEAIIKYYDTPEGVRNVWRQLLDDIRNGDDYFVFGDPERYSSNNEKFFKDFIKKRLRTKLNAKLLLTTSKLAKEYKLHAPNFGEEVKLLPERVRFDVNVCITDRRMLIQQIIEPHLMLVIENKSIIEMQKALFTLLWESTT